MSKEIWKPIKQLEGFSVSNLGRIKNNCGYKIRGSKSTFYIVELKTNTTSTYKEKLYFSHKRKKYYIKNIVAEAFLNNDFDKYKKYVINKDSDYTNNKVDNLAVVDMLTCLTYCDEEAYDYDIDSPEFNKAKQQMKKDLRVFFTYRNKRLKGFYGKGKIANKKPHPLSGCNWNLIDKNWNRSYSNDEDDEDCEDDYDEDDNECCDDDIMCNPDLE